MDNKAQGKSLLDRELSDRRFRQIFEESFEAFQLEAQMLHALERKGWSYRDLAKATGTSKSNVSRDLAAGGILSASFSRIGRMAEALGMRLVGLLVPKEEVAYILPKIEELVRDSQNTANGTAAVFRSLVPVAWSQPAPLEQNKTATSSNASFTPRSGNALQDIRS